VTRVENLPRRLERVLDDVEMDTTKINREAEKAHAGLVDVFPRAGELAEVRAKRDRLSAELAADSAEKASCAQAAEQPSAPNGSQPHTPTTVPDPAGQAGRPAIGPPPPPPRPRPDEDPQPPAPMGWSR